MEKVSKACHLLYLLERSLFSSSCVPGTEAESQDRFTQTLLRHCLLRKPLANVTRLEEAARYVAFCLAIWRGTFSVSQCFVSALHKEQVPDGSYSQHCLPAAPPIQDGAPCVTDKTGQGEGMICLLGKFPSSPMLLHGYSRPCVLYVSKKQVPFIFLTFPSPAGFHSRGNARAPFTCLYAT